MTINIISISGGKDSTATALLAIDRGVENIRFVFADTGNESDVTYDYLGYLNEKLIALTGTGITHVKADFSGEIKNRRASLISHYIALNECGKSNPRLKHYCSNILDRMIKALKPTRIPFLDLCLLKGRFPGTRSRFCSQRLKHEPITHWQKQFLNNHTAIISWQGIRRDESLHRASLIEKDVEFGRWEPEPIGQLIYRPILDWKAKDCFSQHKRFQIKWNPLYEKGMGRVGCMPCIHANKAEVREISRRFPEEFKRVAEWEKLVSLASKRGISTFMDARTTARFLGTGKTVNDIKTDTHGINTYVRWAMTSRGGRQFDLIHALDANNVPTCSSVYGLCE